MLVPLIVVVIIMIVGLVIVQMKNSKLATIVNIPVTIEPPEIPVDPVKLDRVKEIVKTLEKEESISPSTTGNIETAKKLIVKSETKNVAVIATVLKEQATIKREESEGKVMETRKKILALDTASLKNLKIIENKGDTVMKINNAFDETVREAARMEVEQKEKAIMLADEIAEKKRQADIKIQAAMYAAEQEKKAKEARAVAFRDKMAKYAADKAAAEAVIVERERKAKQARALEIALKNKALKLEAEAEMKRVLEEQILLQKAVEEKERLELEAAEEARQVRIEENKVRMEEAKIKREEEEARVAEAQAVLDEKILIQREEAEELRLAEEERKAELENERMAAEAEAAAILEEEKERQREMEEEDREIRLEQEDILRELEEERKVEADEAEEVYALEKAEYKELQEQLAEEEKDYLEDQAAEAIASKTEYDANIAANTASIDAALTQNVSASETNASNLVTETDNIQERANVAAETSITVSESNIGSQPQDGPSVPQEKLKFFCLSAELTPETDLEGNNVLDNDGNIKYMAYGEDRRDTTQEPTIRETTCVKECNMTRGGERCEDICSDKRVPNPHYVPPSTWDGIMSREICDGIDGFNWTVREKDTAFVEDTHRMSDENKKYILDSADVAHCIHDGVSDPTFTKVQNCITTGGTTHHGVYRDQKIMDSMTRRQRISLIAEQSAKERELRAQRNKLETEKMMEDNKARVAAHRERIAKEKADYLESLRSDCKYEYSKSVKAGLKHYYDAKGGGFESNKAALDAKKYLVYDETAQHCLPCDPYTKEYLHILKEPSDPGKKSCPTEKIRKTACTPVISCDEYTAKMNVVTRDRHEALLALETANKSELKDLLVYARAEARARASYDRQVKRIDTVVTARQKERYDTNVAEKKVLWDTAAKEYNKEGLKLFNAYYDELVNIPNQLQYCAIRSINTGEVALKRVQRKDALNKKYFGNNSPYDYTVAGEGVYIAPDKFAIMASTLPLKNLPCKSDGNRFSSAVKSVNGPGYLSPVGGQTTIKSQSASVKVKDSYYDSCSAKALKGHGEQMDTSSMKFTVVYDGSRGTTYILNQGRASRYSNGRRELNKRQGSFKIENGGKLVLINANKARDESNVKINGKNVYGKKRVCKYNRCAYKTGRYQRCQGANQCSLVDDTTKPVKNYTYYRRQDQRTELYNFNDTTQGYTLVANFATNDYWLISTNGKYYSVSDNKVHQLDSSLKCKITKPVISNAIGGFQGMKKHLQSCFDKPNSDCADVYRNRVGLTQQYLKYKQKGYSNDKLLLWTD